MLMKWNDFQNLIGSGRILEDILVSGSGTGTCWALDIGHDRILFLSPYSHPSGGREGTLRRSVGRADGERVVERSGGDDKLFKYFCWFIFCLWYSIPTYVVRVLCPLPVSQLMGLGGSSRKERGQGGPLHEPGANDGEGNGHRLLSPLLRFGFSIFSSTSSIFSSTSSIFSSTSSISCPLQMNP